MVTENSLTSPSAELQFYQKCLFLPGVGKVPELGRIAPGSRKNQGSELLSYNVLILSHGERNGA